MRHVVSEPESGSVVRLHAGDWLEVQLSHNQTDADWQVVEQPGCLFPLTETVADRPSVLPVGPRRRSLGFLAFGASGQQAQPLRLALVNRRCPERSEVRELSVLVS
ncbi:hypothetical protein [Nocardioides sp.]|uniref:hypothetical protein n=1 Tax=Nocardioides sp. TaxID=35761 RepID=UPI003D11AF82